MPEWFAQPTSETLERLEWLTDVLPSFDGGEQRRALRLAPRRFLEFETVLTGAERRALENALHGQQSAQWRVPLWPDAQPLSSSLSAAATTIQVDTTTRDFRVGGEVALILDARRYEVATIDAVTDTELTLDAGLAAGWPAGQTIVAPVLPAVLPDEQVLQRFTGDASYGRLRWEIVGPNDWPAASEPVTYRSLPVLTQAPRWSEDVEQGYRRLLSRVDNGTGGFFIDDEAGGPHLLQSHRWLLDGRAEIEAFRGWLYAREGRRNAFWLPTWALDLAVVASIGSAATTIDVEHCGYVDNVAQAVGRRDIRILTHAGTAYHRRITASAEISATVERLTIDSALGAALAPADIAAVSFMSAARLEADAAEILWSGPDVAEAALMTRAARNAH